MYNILVADDSALMRKLMCDIIESVQNFNAADVCADGEMAYNKLKAGSYDAMFMNANMPRVNGPQLLRRMKMDRIKVPVIIISSEAANEQKIADEVLSLGAKDFIPRPYRMNPSQRQAFERTAKNALHAAVQPGGQRTYKSTPRRPASSSSVIREPANPGRKPAQDILSTRARGKMAAERAAAVAAAAQKKVKKSGPVQLASSSGYNGRYSLVAIASSTGGPQALNTLLPMFPANIGVPMVIVQHMPRGFTASLAERIDGQSKLTVKEAENGEILQKNTVYIAPGGRHLEIVNAAGGALAAKVYDAPPVNNLRPCADVMYESLKKVSQDHILCAVLTGMGADGSKGIASLKRNKDLYVITQSEDTCVVYGMPKAADQSGLSNESQPITEISKSITKKLGV